MPYRGIIDAETRRENRIILVRRWIVDHRVTIGQVLAAVLTLIAGGLAISAKHAVWMWLLIGVAVIITIASAVWAVKEEARISHLRNAIEKKDCLIASEREALRRSLESMSQRLLQELGLWTEHCRLSIYGHEERHLFLLTRVSNNPTLKTQGRPKYPDTQGYIGLVWKRGKFLQRWRGRDSAFEFALKNGFTREEAEELSMIPLSVAGMRVNGVRDHIGVVLLESERKADLGDEVYSQLLDSAVFWDIHDMVCAAEEIFEPISQPLE